MAPQLSFADLEWQRQGLAVDATLLAIGELLEAQPGLIARVHDDLVRGLRQPHTGRDGLTAEQTLRAYVL
jgi:IS5 family transposase